MDWSGFTPAERRDIVRVRRRHRRVKRRAWWRLLWRDLFGVKAR